MAKMDAGFTNERWRRLPPPLPDDGAVSTSRSGCAPTCCGAHWTDDKEDVAKEEAEEIVGTIIIVVVVTTRAVSTIIIMRRKGSRARMKMKGRDQDVSHTTELRVPDRGTDVLGRFTGRNHVLYEGVVKRTRELRATPRM